MAYGSKMIGFKTRDLELTIFPCSQSAKVRWRKQWIKLEITSLENKTTFCVTVTILRLFQLVRVLQFWRNTVQLDCKEHPWTWLTRRKDLLSFVHVVFKTANAVISRCCFAEDGSESFSSALNVQNAFFSCSINQIVNLLCCCCFSRRQC